MNTDRFLQNLMHQAEENPVIVMGVAAGLLTALSKLIGASNESRNSRTWRREELRRERKDARRTR